MKRAVDIVAACLGLAVFAIPMLVIALLVKLTSRGPALYWSDRVGRDNTLFRMPKFRTMRVEAPELATHLLAEAGFYVTPLGAVLRRTSLDELPQLYNVLRGEMSLVGPRPALHNQEDLVAQRTERGVHRLVPGVTGWAQINGRDELPILVKVEYDAEYMRRRGFWFDLLIVLKTVLKVVRAEGVKH